MEYKLFKQEPAVINIGVKPFADGVKNQGVKAVHLAWKPPVDPKLCRMIRTMEPSLKEKIEKSNAEAIDIENSTNSYTETNVPAEMDRELTVEDMIEMLKELGVDTDDQQA